MGAIQGAMGNLAATAIAGVAAGKHISQQKSQLEEQKKQGELTSVYNYNLAKQEFQSATDALQNELKAGESLDAEEESIKGAEAQYQSDINKYNEAKSKGSKTVETESGKVSLSDFEQAIAASGESLTNRRAQLASQREAFAKRMEEVVARRNVATENLVYAKSKLPGGKK